MEKIQLINVEWNIYNGTIIEILNINDKCLLGLNIGYKSFIHIHLLFIPIYIYDKIK